MVWLKVLFIAPMQQASVNGMGQFFYAPLAALDHLAKKIGGAPIAPPYKAPCP
ncbi:hypothetical protein [Iodidimonas nitroreducens]|uniref:hypothetical protein n=1 Tax=Iodidimonas nitroreducens TaxID=1236968 RepID=UPI0028D007C5|nr:hypothetical protein [Iodidimonas nitroreducens]